MDANTAEVTQEVTAAQDTRIKPINLEEFKKIIETEFKHHMPQYAELPADPLIHIFEETNNGDITVHLSWMQTDSSMYNACRLLPTSLITPWIETEQEPRFFDVAAEAYVIIVHFMRNLLKDNG